MSLSAWQKFLKGDETSFSQFYGEYFKELFAYGIKLGFDKETCRDAIQDVFFNIYVSRNKLTRIRNIEFYLLHCMKNRLFDIYNEEIRIAKIDYREVVSENEQTIAEKLIKNEQQQLIQSEVTRLLKELPGKQRKIIYFRYNLNLNYHEIGAIMEMNPASVKKSLQRALKKMKEIAAPIVAQILLAAAIVG